MLVFAMKNEKNRPFFKEKVKFDGYSIKQAFIMKNIRPLNLINLKILT
ncbi:Uncharacterised protein [Moraxella lacunata]|uniref:Uncharacterized protein n=1 Tax=Moraxella lacunata TaxID=477 RepID=A0A378T590_MORLA|nr:Uncharacterised protein [Moraxella lacunata]